MVTRWRAIAIHVSRESLHDITWWQRVYGCDIFINEVPVLKLLVIGQVLFDLWCWGRV